MHVDLNLLTALDALLEERSVSAAAARLHLSQPAMSRTLGRIRDATGDPILVRAGRTMTPTPRALALRQEVHAIVQRARAVLTPERELDLGRLDRTFAVRCHDALTTAIGARLLRAVQEQAPLVKIRLLAEPAADTDDLRHGRVDLEIGSTEPAIPEIRGELIGQDRVVVAVRRGHPLAQGRLTARRYAQALHVIVSRRGRLRDPVDDALDSLGLRRRVVAAAPTTAAAMHLVHESDLVVALPARVCGPVLRTLGLGALPLPLEVPALRIVQLWHRRHETDKAHAWLRGLTREILQAVVPDDRRPARARLEGGARR
ncbi:LysR family transcriptional regulator [Sorangium sp. So ce1335]|uniref:LysR family transcriptional regulator n=1 Tax=Sorangium sp. So ce1335 TaxID=3133335 RepID=UPI003F5EC928